MIKVRVPATSANMGPGFDSIGIALSLYNTFTFEEIPRGVEIISYDERFNNEDNLVYLSMIKTMEKVGHKVGGIRITIESEIPVSRGLGSSAACIIGGVLGANELADSPLTKDEILKIATNIEGHPDNVAPALFGGLVTSIMEGKEILHNQISVAKGLEFVALIPDLTLSTSRARSVLPKKIKYEDAVFNVSRVALMISALSNGDFQLLKYGLQDRLHQPYRSKLIPDFNMIMDICIENDSLGTFLSGAGPTVMALTNDFDGDFTNRLQKKLNNLRNKWTIKELKIDQQGSVIFHGD
ncbi:homoserine kinase [Tissierella sp. Yu-01]|uniref:homoserine kinase n=1 Tax=Tissierella sp. Yu-01 TaxID=3035694 RepID=UPI00240D19E4|nr:homoserine kinase [Tissierella sp. Yu-01]WFA08422.1 homoserine kinase [Tissierella sp. Yu-01]